MASPGSNPPSYLRSSIAAITDPFTTPPQRKTHFVSHSSKPSPAFSTKYGRLEELELQATGPEPLSSPASLILPPPAVTTYAYAQSASSYALQRSPLHSLQKQTKQLTEELQGLLDAQSAALMSGGSFSGAQSSGSPYLQSSKRGGRRRPTSLQEARNGILMAMQALAEIKEVEEEVYASQAAEREGLVKTIEGWGNKRQLLEKEIHGIEEGDDGQRAEALREEKSEIENELHQLRLHLSKLESKHSSISMQLSELESTISSKTSSYQASLISLKQKTASFLSAHRYASPLTAIESWTLEKEALDEKKQQVKTEGDALRDGIVMWEDALSLVAGFEDKLRAQLVASGKRPAGGAGDVKQKIVHDIEGVIEQLEQRLKLAEERNWKLLVCCVGAELQVFLEAREVMKRSLGAAPAPSISSADTSKSSGLDDSESQTTDEGISQSSTRGESIVGSSRRSVFSNTARDPKQSARRVVGPRRTSGSLRRVASPTGAGNSLLDRSDDGHSGDSGDAGRAGEEEEEEDNGGELLLKIDDGVGTGKDYSPLDD